MDEATAVLVDTDVWSLVYTSPARRDPRAALWRLTLLGRTVVIAIQTRAEVLTGAFVRDWSAERTSSLLSQLDRTATVPVDRGLADTYACLSGRLRRSGHALSAKEHTADRWIAATAIHVGLPLLSGDGIYRDVVGLHLLPRDD